MTPWQYLKNLVMMDRGPEHDEAWLNMRLQNMYPGPYRVEPYQVPSNGAPYISYHIVFDDPKEETMFTLKWGGSGR